VLRLKRPWRDGATNLLMTPLDFSWRLAALVPRAQWRLIRFDGVWTPAVNLCAQASLSSSYRARKRGRGGSEMSQ
jgi:hypothetical protein